MQLTFHGAAQTVTGSQHLIDVNGIKILLDCGLYQGRRAEAYKRNLNFPFDPTEIDMVILSHAHIDHSGNLPNLVKQGFVGDIISTSATRDLCATMLLDSGHIQERDAEYVNKMRARKNEAPIEPLYTQKDAMDAMPYFTTQDYYRQRQIAPNIYLAFKDAGHMLGSCIVQLDIADQDTGRDVRLVFSGDLGREGIPIIRDPETIERADILIMESTYGNRLHETYTQSHERLVKVINDTYQRGGSIVMPAFAVGRTQQLVLALHELMEADKIPNFPIYVDSPLAVNVTSVFEMHPECYDDEIRQFMFNYDVDNPFGFDDLTYIRKVEDSKALNTLRTPHIVISASGMAEFGRVLHHLKNRIEDHRNTVLITGWQAPYTLGRRLVEKRDVVKVFGEEYTRRAQVETLNGFSGHADRDELLEWVGAIQQKPDRTFLVHGEEEAATALQKSLTEQFNMTVDVPYLGQVFTI